jgi:triosephosphate isomerase
MQRRPIVAGNWKMNNNTAQATQLAQAISYGYDPKMYDGVDVIVCPPFTDLRSVHVVFDFDHCDIALGGQDVYWEENGAFTGEISAPMLREIGCSYCIIGHSERREHFGETDETVNKKALALLSQRIQPIICCGEDLECHDAGGTLDWVLAQVEGAYAGLTAEQAAKTVVAYEPIWAIGTGRTATPETAEAVCAAIRGKIAELYGQPTADGLRILYGGSMKPANVEQFAPCANIDGGLIGGAALEAEDFLSLVKAFIGK